MRKHGLQGREEYLLPSLWCLHLYFYEVEMEMGGEKIHLIPGSLTVTPPGTPLVYQYERKVYRHFFVHFALRSTPPRVAIPRWQHLPDGQDEILDRLQNMQRILVHNPLHAETLFWGLLWDLVESGRWPRTEPSGDARIRTIETFVEDHLPAKITVEAIAAHLGVCAAQVNRIVKKTKGQTTVQLIRQRRLQRASRFLQHSTLPVKLIAAECGIDDLQQFNKLMRAAYGKSPRQLRGELPEGGEPTWSINRA